MTRLQVYDPPMCCSTGVCGPQVDPRLPRFAADLEWLRNQGVEVERYNLAQQPSVFVETEAVKQALKAEGERCLPLVLLDGETISRGSYPSRDELAAWLGLEFVADGSLYTHGVEELVAIAAAIGANCESCFNYHFEEARKAGVTRDDIALAVATARKVKQAAAQAILTLAGKHLAAEREIPPLLKIAPCGPGDPDGATPKCC
jgi:AhpD family alkylhydroperoxidase